MRCVIDIEANSLVNPTNIWVIVCKDIDTGEYHIFREVTSNDLERDRFVAFSAGVTLWIGHNLLGYDAPVCDRLLGTNLTQPAICLDTLIISKLVDYPRSGHSLAHYGEEFEIEKSKFTDYSKYSLELENRCITDVDINLKVYLKYLKYISKEEHKSSILMEHKFQLIVNDLSTNGFSFNTTKASSLLTTIVQQLNTLDSLILSEFTPKEVLIREFTPRATKFGTISKTSVPRSLWEEIHKYEVGITYRHTKMVPFNPSSHKQIIEVLNAAGWRPIDKTQTHIDTLREINRLKRDRSKVNTVDLDSLYAKLVLLEKCGWKVNENNLSTLPETAPSPARSLAKRILLEARRRSLTEWLSLVCLEIKINKKNIKIIGGDKKTDAANGILNGIMDSPSRTIIEWLKTKKVNAKFVSENDLWLWITIIPQEQHADYYAVDAIAALDGLKTIGLEYSITSERINGRFQGIGAWTHRMAHQQPNTANIPNEFDTAGKVKLLGKEMRQLWQAPRNRLLVGVDAEGIQLRILAHYIDDAEFTHALVNGDKARKTDPHSLNQKIIGSVCKSRAAAKRFIYALVLGGGMGKLAEILECSIPEAEQALDNLIERYQGWALLKQTIIPRDARNGYFTGLDGRKVRIPGDTTSERRHLCMSGYLQNGEAVCMKSATILWYDKLKELVEEFPRLHWLLVDLVHDEWQTEVNNNVELAERVAQIQCDALRSVGEMLNLKCPLAGSYYNDDHHKNTIGTNWYQTH